MTSHSHIHWKPPGHWMPGDRILIGKKIHTIIVVDLSPGGMTQTRPRTWKEWWHDLTTEGKPSKLWISNTQFKWIV